MKKLYIIFLITFAMSCKAQTVIPIYSNQERIRDNNHYLKDVDNDFDKFIGTWKWENGDTSLTIGLENETRYQFDNESIYRDMLVGEYQYIENGVEKANTLSRLSDVSIEGYSHKISMSHIISKIAPPPCSQCDISERRVLGMIEHQTTEDVNARIVFRYINDNGVEKIEARIYGRRAPFLFKEDRTAPTEMDVPYGNYTLIKQ